MASRSILSTSFITAACATGILLSAPASADVLEINDDGATWLNGPNQRDNEQGGKKQAAPGDDRPVEQLPDTIVVPDEIVAEPDQHALRLPEPFREEVIMLASRFDISPALLEALVWQESRWRADAVSPVGARGLAQLMPETARYLGVDPDQPLQNLEGGARYLREQLDRFDGDVEKALAAYNAGPGRVIAAGGIPPIRETQHYVAAIMGRLSDHSRSSL